ncbi:SPOR domain-containing protein [Hoeflea sp.]|uniref:SPOR domain-containing protein n=1 Tax=Hoeflea sp. TaxID=1940281 RepID=UPI003BB00CEB
MADQLERNTRAPNPEIENDDPLAELARIIGYERPAGGKAEDAGQDVPDQGGFDLESELMRELDVLPLDGFDELDLADDTEDLQPSPVSAEPAQDVQADVPEIDDAFEQDDAFEFSVSWLDNKPETPENDGQDTLEPAADDYVEPDLDSFDIGADSSDVDIDAPAGRQPLSDISLAPPPSDTSDDAVLADMFRYDLPNQTVSPVALTPGRMGSSGSSDAQDALLGSDDLPDFDDEAEPNQNPDWVETSPVSDGDYDARDISPAPAETSANSPASSAVEIDFEDYLSAELDVFEQQASMGGQDRDQSVEADTWEQDGAGWSDSDEIAENDGAAVSSAAASASEIAAGEPDHALAEDDYSLEDDFVFDEAAEELLADIEQEEAIAQAEIDDDYTEEDLEAGLDEGISGEFDELFSFDDDDAPAGSEDRSVGSDLELDMDQVLAEAVIDPVAAPRTEAANRSSGDLERALAGAVVPSAMRGASAFSSSRDEMAEAFKDLVSDQDDETPVAAEPHVEAADAAAASGSQAAPDEDDWLSGLDDARSDERSREAPDDSGFFFDSELIAEPDEPVETLADIDVPEMAEDESWSLNRDFESEVDQEFSDIIDSELGSADMAAERETSAVAAGVSGWRLESESEASGADAFDDYASLERELDDRELTDNDADVAPPYRAGGTGHDPDGLEGEYATGLQAADDGEQRDSRAPLVALIVLGVAVFAGAGAFGWSMMSGGDDDAADGPRIIRADTEPVKVLPENPGGVTVPNQDKAVYDRVAGGDAAQTGQRALVNTAEEPVDVVQRTLDPDVLPLEGRNEAVAVKSEDRLTADSGAESTAGSGAGAPVVSPRRVRTMIVRPDGSIVPREEPAPEIAQAETGSGDETVTAQPASEATAEAPTAPREPQQDTAASAAAALETEAAQAGTTAEPASADGGTTEGTVAPVRVVTTQPIRAPVPQGRPADQPVNVVGTVTQGGNVANPVQAPAAQAPAAQPAAQEVASAATAPVSNPGGYYVQIASQPTAEGAQASWQTLSNRYSSVIGGRGVDIQRADIPGKGVFHRVRIPAGGRDEANALCSRYKAAGGSCFVSR